MCAEKHGKMVPTTSEYPMPKAPVQTADPQASPDDVETAFYQALQSADIEKLMACWADEDDILCIHPGGSRVIGAAAIRAAFEAIFGHEGSIRVQPESIRRVDGTSACVHSVLERIEVMTSEGPMQAHVLATNVYYKTTSGWRLIAHHASPGTQDALHEINTQPVLH